MKISPSIRRIAASAILAAGLAYPACAAVCPKGHGSCPSPGKCFLFVDADANSLCDYTGRTGSQTGSGSFSSTPGIPDQAQTAIQSTATQVPDTTMVLATTTPLDTAAGASVTQVDTTTTLLENTSSGGFLDSIHLPAPVAEIIFFFLMTGIFFALFRRVTPEKNIKNTRAALALSSFFGLGTSLILTCILSGSGTSGTTYALVYMGIGTLLAAYLWHEGLMTRKHVLGAAALGTLAGFVFLAPVMPMELGGIVNVLTGVSALTVGVIVICAVILLALGVGRVFCGNICPVGSLQELTYAVPIKKVVIRHTDVVELIRLAVFLATVVAAIYLVDLMAFTGLYDLFSLTLSTGLIIAAGLVLISAFLYRPVCRVICPFGVLFSLFAGFSLFRLKRTGDCIACGKCEKACPTRTAVASDPKRECYLCARCKEVCPVNTALAYGR